MTATARPESVGLRLEPRLPLRFQRAECQGLQRPVGDHRNAERSLTPVGLRYEHPLDGLGFPRFSAAVQPVGQLGLRLWQQRRLAVDARRLAASIDLRHPPHAQQRVGAGAEHQLLQIADLGQVPCLRRREDPLPQTPYVVLDLVPIDRQPVGDLVLRSVRHGDGRRGGLRRVCGLRCLGVQLVLRFRCRRSSSLHRLTWPTSAPFRVRATARIRPVIRDRRRSGRPPMSRFPAAFRPPAFASWPSCSRRGFGLPHGRPTGQQRCPDLDGVPTFHTSEIRPGWVPPIPRGRWCPPG